MKRIWILIHVFHGLIQEPEIFHDKKAAKQRLKELRLESNRDYDEVELFEHSLA